MKQLIIFPFLFLSIDSIGQDTVKVHNIDSIVALIDADINLQKKVIVDTERIYIEPNWDPIRIIKYNLVFIEVYADNKGQVVKIAYYPQKSNPQCPAPKTFFYYYNSKAIKAIVGDYSQIYPRPKDYFFDSVIYFDNDQIIKVSNRRDPIDAIEILNLFYEFRKM